MYSNFCPYAIVLCSLDVAKFLVDLRNVKLIGLCSDGEWGENWGEKALNEEIFVLLKYCSFSLTCFYDSDENGKGEEDVFGVHTDVSYNPFFSRMLCCLSVNTVLLPYTVVLLSCWALYAGALVWCSSEQYLLNPGASAFVSEMEMSWAETWSRVKIRVVRYCVRTVWEMLHYETCWSDLMI